MKRILLLTYRYLTYHKWRTGILIAAISVTIFLPLSVTYLVDYYNEKLVERAENTPLVAGAKGSRFDLILNNLYFNAPQPDRRTMAEVEEIQKKNGVNPIPMYNRYTVAGGQFPVVGTRFDYFDFRDLQLESGEPFQMLGDCVLGYNVAQELGKETGDTLLTDYKNIYDISASYPLKMKITGVLKKTETPDDNVVFADIKTTWVIEGIGHGHQKVTEDMDPNVVLKKEKDTVVLNEAIVGYQEITPENLGSFHFHGNLKQFPVTGIIVVPESDKARTMLKGDYVNSKTMMILEPKDVISDLMNIVFQVKKFFDANFVMVGVSTLLFLVLVIMLTLRIRKKEIETLYKIGCSRTTVFLIQASEICVVLLASVAVASVLSVALLTYVISTGLIFGL